MLILTPPLEEGSYPLLSTVSDTQQSALRPLHLWTLLLCRLPHSGPLLQLPHTSSGPGPGWICGQHPYRQLNSRRELPQFFSYRLTSIPSLLNLHSPIGLSPLYGPGGNTSFFPSFSPHQSSHSVVRRSPPSLLRYPTTTSMRFIHCLALRWRLCTLDCVLRHFNEMSDHHGIFTQFFLDPEVIFSSHTMFIIASTKEFNSCKSQALTLHSNIYYTTRWLLMFTKNMIIFSKARYIPFRFVNRFLSC